MKIPFLVFAILFLVTTGVALSQNQSDIVYRTEGEPESPNYRSYVVSVLFLSKDGNYTIKHQEYSSKRMMKKNILNHLEEEKGVWKEEDGKYVLTDFDTNTDTKFKIKSKNKIAIISRDSFVSPFNWTRIE